jgi:pyruvate/2-oxoglutarate dehydrogenase complex dihydrolipoamide acyltransferase (E2) component
MPVARYFLFVGGVLLALLLAVDALVPQQAVVASQATPSVDKTVVRIRSDQKPPERVVYDTSLPTIVPPRAATAQAVVPSVPTAAPASASADASAQARVRETFAQFVPEEAKKPEPQRKRKVAKSRPPMQIAQQRQMRVAQQSHFGFFGGPNWNSTW